MFTARDAGARHKRYQAELALRYQIVETYYPEFLDYMENQGKTLPTHLKKNSMLI